MFLLSNDMFGKKKKYISFNLDKKVIFLSKTERLSNKQRFSLQHCQNRMSVFVMNSN